MGLRDLIKDKILRHEGGKYKNMDWLKRNKTGIGAVFTLFGVYVWMFSCPGLENYCGKIGLVLTNIGTFLSGAGIIDSDYREKIVQGVVPKPLPEVK